MMMIIIRKTDKRKKKAYNMQLVTKYITHIYRFISGTLEYHLNIIHVEKVTINLSNFLKFPNLSQHGETAVFVDLKLFV